MLVKDYMTRHPLMAEPTMSIVEAQRYMGENDIRHLPVVGDGKRLLGLVTRQSLLVDPGRLGSLDIWEIAGYLSDLTVKDVMVKADAVVTVEQGVTIEEAARIMVGKKIGCLPVLGEGIVVGIITEIDLLAQLMKLMATQEAGVRVTVRQPNRTGELAKMVSAIAAQGWGILACGGAPAPKDPTKWDAVVKIRNAPREEVVAALETVEDQEIVDVREV
ncbi:MAG: Hypoxic response protein 1 [Anaerolineales bacterium]|nr:Hypoxic response protein 1 [Anaerolineales bacterium]